MPTKRRILEELTRERLLEFARLADLPGLTNKNKAEIVEALAAAKRARLRDFLPQLTRDELKHLCVSNGLDDGGREKQVLIDRLLGREADAAADAEEASPPPPGPVPPPPAVPPAATPQLATPPKRPTALDPVEDYRHEGATRKNIPPAKLAAEGKVPVLAKIEYRYSPRRPPVLRFDATGRADRLPQLLEDARQRKLSDDEVRILAEALRAQEPWLEWSGKRETPGFAVDPVALHIHERISAQAILKVASRQDIERSLFADPEQDYHDAVQFYRHDIDWANRLILGDSLQVMASLAKREDLAGKVQMIYIDPPYGIKFASNFQPEVGKRDVKEQQSDLTREPEMVKAYRDTWNLGIHSYLSYLRDRLILTKEMLADKGSIFVQMGDENVDRVRSMMDEVFGNDNFISLITCSKTTNATAALLPGITDYIIWFAKNKANIKYRPVYRTKQRGAYGGEAYVNVELINGSRRRTSTEEADAGSNPVQMRYFSTDNLTSSRVREARTGYYEIDLDGNRYLPRAGEWKTNRDGMKRLKSAERLAVAGETPRYVRYIDDFSAFPLTNLWSDVGGAADKIYVVQSANRLVERCLLMTTDPGDLVLDPTCGSGTTAYVAEQWGRRWITIDTSRVAVAIARQRLLTAKYDYYQFRDENAGVAGNFKYKTVPHITLKSIAQNQNLDPIFAKHEPILDARLSACTSALGKVAKPVRDALFVKLVQKEKKEGSAR